MEQEREGEEWEQEESVCLLYNTLRTHVGCLRETSSGWHLWRCVKAGILPFLRGAALFFRHLNGVPIPPELNAGIRILLLQKCRQHLLTNQIGEFNSVVV
ncbi:E3 ubiquitin-protein ligase UBR2-like isoform X1 [Ictalurus furcatus]|uniref:E3 ubiquitin-protein ligase UBR2-like isoform X1 n=1 Tax=Ictalurus furcatus TaxID=66913 RepID=UPI00235042BF|nr:E3 ubiquitin-protein ligase UBR2-like isoform X1 [Ictalurus furcatus]